MNDNDIVFSSISETAKRIKARELSPISLTELLLERIEEKDPSLNSFITVTSALAREQAKQADKEIAQGHYRGSLHGIPIALKDLYATKGIRTTFASNAYKDWLPDFDATAWSKLANAGAILVGKANLSELAADGTGTNSAFGPIHNAWNHDFISGGSSGGSAVAVAAGLSFGALGSDTAMSIRQPAALNGLVGLKPTFGRVSKYGALTLSFSLDHVGPMTRTVRDAALMLQVIAGHDGKDPTTVNTPIPDFSCKLGQSIKGKRIGVPRNDFFTHTDPEWLQATEKALSTLSALGAEIEDISLPDINDLESLGFAIIFAECASFHADKYQKKPERFGARGHLFITFGQQLSGVQYIQAQRARRKISESLLPICAQFDALALPTSNVETAVFGHDVASAKNTIPFNALGLPAITLPSGFDKNGIPIGLQLVGQPFGEVELFSVAHAYEQATDFHLQHPEL